MKESALQKKKRYPTLSIHPRQDLGSYPIQQGKDVKNIETICQSKQIISLFLACQSTKKM